MNRIKPYLGVSLILALQLFIYFSPYFMEGKILAPLDIKMRMFYPWKEDAGTAKAYNTTPTDAVTQYLPYRMYAEKAFKEDGYIGWNPFELGGVSLAANTMATPADWTIQLHRWMPFVHAWNLGLLAQFFSAGLGMFVFLRGRRLPWIACAIGAVAYMGNSQFVIWIYHRWALGSFCWMPWVLWAASRWQGWGDWQTRRCLLPIFLALAMLGGTLQHCVFVVLVCAALFLADFRLSNGLTQNKRLLGGWVLVGVIAVVIACFSLYPQVDAYLQNLGTGNKRGGLGYSHGLAQPLLHLIALPPQIFPWLAGRPQTLDGFKILKYGDMHVAYLGSIAMIFAIVGLFLREMPKAAKILILTGLLVPLTPLVGPLYHRVHLLFLLGGAWMAAEVTAVALRKPLPTVQKIVILPAACLLLFLGAMSILPQSVRGAMETQLIKRVDADLPKAQFGDDPSWYRTRAKTWLDELNLVNPRTAWWSFLAITGAASAAILAGKNKKFATSGALSVLLIGSLEHATFFKNWCTFSNPDELTASHPGIEEVRKLANGGAVKISADGAKYVNVFGAPNLLSSLGVKVIDGYESIQPKSIINSHPTADMGLLYDFAGVTLSIQPHDLPPTAGTADWPISDQIGRYDVRSNHHALALILCGNAETASQNLSLEQWHQVLKSATPTQPSRQTMSQLEFQIPANTQWIRIGQNWHKNWKWRSKNSPETHSTSMALDGSIMVYVNKSPDTLSLQFK